MEKPLNKTEYRIIPFATYIADQYLQFKRITNDKEDWCFIPTEDRPKILGQYMTSEECPTELLFKSSKVLASDFLHCFYCLDSSLISFAKKYPDIDLYFVRLKNLRENYVKEKEEQQKNSKIIYL